MKIPLTLSFALALTIASAAGAAESAFAANKDRSSLAVPVRMTGGSFVARIADYEAVVYADTATGRVTAAKMGFRFKDVKTGNAARDAAMLVWQQTDDFPTVAFALTGLQATGGEKFLARGTLTLHGATREVAFPVTIARDGDGFTVDGRAEIDTRDYGLRVARRLILFSVDPHVPIQIHLVVAPLAK